MWMPDRFLKLKFRMPICKNPWCHLAPGVFDFSLTYQKRRDFYAIKPQGSDPTMTALSFVQANETKADLQLKKINKGFPSGSQSPAAPLDWPPFTVVSKIF
jgi:hypothetical protein